MHYLVAYAPLNTDRWMATLPPGPHPHAHRLHTLPLPPPRRQPSTAPPLPGVEHYRTLPVAVVVNGTYLRVWYLPAGYHTTPGFFATYHRVPTTL